MIEDASFCWLQQPKKTEPSVAKQATCNVCFEEYAVEELGGNCKKQGCNGRIVDPKSLPNF